MPREIRKIFLNDAEFSGAIESFRRIRKELLPPGTLQGIQTQPDGNLLIAIEMKFGPNTRNDEFVLESQYVVEALARFCIENNIVIPRGGTKKVARTEKEWVLEIRMKASEMAQHAAQDADERVARVQSGIDATEGV